MCDVNDVATDQLRSFVERIERLEDETKTISDDIKDVYPEAQGTRRTEDRDVTISLSTVGENGERVTTPPVDLETFRKATDAVARRGKTKRRDPDEALRDERAKGPVFS